MSDRQQVASALAAIERALSERVEVWRVIVDEHGNPTTKRIYRCSFYRPRGPEPPKEKP
jgi:hypothetical protein